MYNLFLDDYRNPEDCTGYVNSFGIRPDTYTNRSWVIVRNFKEFTSKIVEKGMPNLISFDHDLADIYYLMNDVGGFSTEETGMDCAKWLVGYCMDTEIKLPDFLVHSMNPVGRRNIQSYLQNYKDRQ